VSKPKTAPKPSQFEGAKCRICQTAYERGKRRFVNHHLQYADPEVKVTICKTCDNWLHGNGPSNNHPFKKMFPKDQAPYIFAVAVVDMYERELIVPQIEAAARKEQTLLKNAAIIHHPKAGKETMH